MKRVGVSQEPLYLSHSPVSSFLMLDFPDWEKGEKWPSVKDSRWDSKRRKMRDDANRWISYIWFPFAFMFDVFLFHFVFVLIFGLFLKNEEGRRE